jgi:hypothetical protein
VVTDRKVAVGWPSPDPCRARSKGAMSVAVPNWCSRRLGLAAGRVGVPPRRCWKEPISRERRAVIRDGAVGAREGLLAHRSPSDCVATGRRFSCRHDLPLCAGRRQRPPFRRRAGARQRSPGAALLARSRSIAIFFGRPGSPTARNARLDVLSWRCRWSAWHSEPAVDLRPPHAADRSSSSDQYEPRTTRDQHATPGRCSAGPLPAGPLHRAISRPGAALVYRAMHERVLLRTT